MTKLKIKANTEEKLPVLRTLLLECISEQEFQCSAGDAEARAALCEV
jgi:hypothetical protein